MPAASRLQPRRHLLWVMAVFVLALLAPGVSAALAQARGEITPWQEICRSPASPGGKQATPLEQLTHGHCPACQISAAAITPPVPPVAAEMLRNDLGFEAPERFWSAPKAVHAWTTAPARAPPALS
jgi:Protein of unknown function (DUF2946)